MSNSATLSRVLNAVRESNLIAGPTLDALLQNKKLPADPSDALNYLVQAGLLTHFHAQHLLEGKSKGFNLGCYKVLRPLGHGGVGLVYLAEHRELKRRVAIKVIRSDRQNAEVVARFVRESRAAAALDHPNLIRVHDFCQENDNHFLVMEYIRGQSFAEVMKRRGRLPSWEAVGLILQAARGLSHAHARNIIHRDVKPANLLVDADGVVKVLDLGLARFLDHRADDLTERLGGGMPYGSPDYVAPEQALQAPDERSDVYSLAATLYALLVGEPPFAHERTASSKVAAHQLQPVVPPHRRDYAIPEELSLAVVRMLSKKPSERYQTIDQVIEVLTPFAKRPQGAPTPPPIEVEEQEETTGGGRRIVIWAGVAVAVIVAALAAWFILARR